MDSPSRFYVPVKDEHGHSGDFHCRIHPGIVRDADELFQIGKDAGAPWKTLDDCQRAVVLWGTKSLAEALHAVPQSGGVALDLFLQTVRLEVEQASIRDVMDDTKRAIEKLSSIGAHERIKQIVKAGWRAINKVSYPHWRFYLLREFEKEFGHIMPKNVSLDVEDMENEDGYGN